MKASKKRKEIEILKGKREMAVNEYNKANQARLNAIARHWQQKIEILDRELKAKQSIIQIRRKS